MQRCLLVTLIMIGSCLSSLHSSEALSDGGLFLIYGDSNLNAISSLLKKELKSQLKDADVKIDSKGKRGQSLSDALKNIDKDVLKKKPALVLLQLSTTDWYDSKAKELLTHAPSTATLDNQLRDFVNTCTASGIKVSIATPCLAGENIADDRQIDQTLDSASEHIRTLCKELEIACCDYRSLVVKHLQANNPDNKSKGILSKDGIKISKEGAEVLAPAMQKLLGMSKNGIGKALTAQDQIRFFDHGFFKFSKIQKEIDVALLAKFPDVAGPVKPSFKFVNIDDITYAKEAPSSQITNHNARVSFVYIGHRLKDVPRHKFSIFQDIHTQICKDLKEKVTGTVYLLTLPPISNDPDDSLNKLRIRQNDVIRNNAIDNGFNLLDLHKIVAATYTRDPMFKLVVPGANFNPPSEALGAMLLQEIESILGIVTE